MAQTLAYSNAAALPLSVAVFLATDNYDHDSTTISATTLLKPLRQIILAKRVAPEDGIVDVGDLVQSRLGQAVHDGIERAWINDPSEALRKLNIPAQVIKRIKVNPDPATINEDEDIPVYLEQRSSREILGVTVSGKYDFLAGGVIEDFKTTSTFTFSNQNKTDDYQLQGSIYRWLNPTTVTEDYMRITFIFTDWKAGQAFGDNYPPHRIVPQIIPLLSIEETETFIRNKLMSIQQYMDADEADLPYCTPKELWRDAPVFKYYKNPEKRTRSTKNFSNQAEANQKLAADGHVGIVVEVPGTVKACKYCPAFSVCTQKDQLIADGSLKF
jgi:hypothetical protein